MIIIIKRFSSHVTVLCMPSGVRKDKLLHHSEKYDREPVEFLEHLNSMKITKFPSLQNFLTADQQVGMVFLTGNQLNFDHEETDKLHGKSTG